MLIDEEGHLPECFAAIETHDELPSMANAGTGGQNKTEQAAGYY